MANKRSSGRLIAASEFPVREEIIMEISFLKDYPNSVQQISEWYYGEWKSIYNDSGMSLDDVKKAVEERMNINKIPLAIVVIDCGRLVGTGCLKTHDMDTRPDLTPWLAGVYVDESRRNEGIGTSIISHLESTARKLGISRLFLYTPKSEQFYSRLGWRIIEHTEYKKLFVTIMEKIMFSINSLPRTANNCGEI